MIADHIPAVLVIVAIGTYVLQLWTGIAYAGWASENSLVEREKSPSIYWFVMSLQTLAFIAIPVLFSLFS